MIRCSGAVRFISACVLYFLLSLSLSLPLFLSVSLSCSIPFNSCVVGFGNCRILINDRRKKNNHNLMIKFHFENSFPFFSSFLCLFRFLSRMFYSIWFMCGSFLLSLSLGFCSNKIRFSLILLFILINRYPLISVKHEICYQKKPKEKKKNLLSSLTPCGCVH